MVLAIPRTDADYSNGISYHYAYDPVGNRTGQDIVTGGQATGTLYTYDPANRLTSVGGLAYNFDANGNLISDGVNTYSYDYANRLVAIISPQGAAAYFYNGLGDRLRETTGAQTTTYAMDLNAGLTQTLSDGTHTYLYGAGRIAQQHGAVTEYFLGDALGSVRQMVDGNGTMTLANSYDPYGGVAMSGGAGQTSYGYTNENGGLSKKKARRWY